MATYTNIPATSAGGGFGADTIIQQPNSASALVNTLELANTYANNTAGSETADWDVTVPVAGTQTALRFGRAFLAAKGAATTSGSTPTVAFPPRAAQLQITLGATATKLLITGLDLAADGGYNLTYYIPTAPGAEVDLKLNDTDATGQLHGYSAGTSVAMFTLTNLWLTDNRSPVDGMLQLRDRGTGISKFYAVTNWDGSNQGFYTGHSTLTANVTSASINNLPIGSTITIARVLPSNA